MKIIFYHPKLMTIVLFCRFSSAFTFKKMAFLNNYIYIHFFLNISSFASKKKNIIFAA